MLNLNSIMKAVVININTIITPPYNLLIIRLLHVLCVPPLVSECYCTPSLCVCP